MKLRSGKIKPSVPLCKCGKYWGSVNHKGMCSKCYKYGNNYETKYKQMLADYVDSKVMKESGALSTLNFASKMVGLELFKQTFQYFKQKNKYITAKFAKKLLRENGIDTTEKSHLVCSFVIDWWNITRKNGFNGTEMCYFGNFGEGITDFQYPPRLPNRNLYHLSTQ